MRTSRERHGLLKDFQDVLGLHVCEAAATSSFICTCDISIVCYWMKAGPIIVPIMSMTLLLDESWAYHSPNNEHDVAIG